MPRIDTGHHNSLWIAKVTTLLRAGLGVEDIAVTLGCDVEHVRAEIRIRRAEGTLADLVAPGYGRTALALMVSKESPAG